MVFSSYSHAFWPRQFFEQNFRYILHLQMAKSGFGGVHRHVDGHHDRLIDVFVQELDPSYRFSSIFIYFWQHKAGKKKNVKFPDAVQPDFKI